MGSKHLLLFILGLEHPYKAFALQSLQNNHCIITSQMMTYNSTKTTLIERSKMEDLLREGEDSFSCMCIPWPGGRAGSSSTMSPQELF